jgi:hypothetical protein
MKLSLLSAIPCSRVDLMRCCKDGRGGWVYSQVDPCRCFTDFKNSCGLFFALSVFAAPAVEPKDSIEHTVLVAEIHGEEIGTSTLEWGDGNWGIDLEDGTVFSWTQSVPITPTSNGLVTVRISVKLRSQPAPIEVSHPAFCHIREEDRDHIQLPRWKWLLSLLKRERRTFRQ